MWRRSAIRTMLIEDVCSLRPLRSDDDEDSVDTRLDKALRRATLVVLLDWTAILLLFLSRAEDHPWLSLGPYEESVFTMGVLAVAVHSGFRLAQLDKLRTVKRILGALEER